MLGVIIIAVTIYRCSIVLFVYDVLSTWTLSVDLVYTILV